MTDKILYVSVYGDGALLDANTTTPDSLRRDDAPECDENGEPIDGETCQPTAILALHGVPKSIRTRALDYVGGNTGADPYSDGYEAMECINAAQRVEVLECGVSWSSVDCHRLGGCFLCGGMHE